MELSRIIVLFDSTSDCQNRTCHHTVAGLSHQDSSTVELVVADTKHTQNKALVRAADPKHICIAAAAVLRWDVWTIVLMALKHERKSDGVTGSAGVNRT
jgi:hypothetical protein